MKAITRKTQRGTFTYQMINDNVQAITDSANEMRMALNINLGLANQTTIF